MERTVYYPKNSGPSIIWHAAADPDSHRMQDVVVAAVAISDTETIMSLMGSGRVKAAAVEGQNGGYLLMYDGERVRPWPSVMIWRYEEDPDSDDRLIADMEFSDSGILKYIWENYLTAEDCIYEYIPPESFIFMEKRR